MRKRAISVSEDEVIAVQSGSAGNVYASRYEASYDRGVLGYCPLFLPVFFFFIALLKDGNISQSQ